MKKIVTRAVTGAAFSVLFWEVLVIGLNLSEGKKPFRDSLDLEVDIIFAAAGSVALPTASAIHDKLFS